MEKGRDFAEVYTVDSYQGQEADVVLFSAVRSQSHNKYSRSVGFLQDLRRANVALTRVPFPFRRFSFPELLHINS